MPNAHPLSITAAASPQDHGDAMHAAIGEARAANQAALAECGSELLARFPITAYLAAWRAAARLAPYHHTPAPARAMCAAIAAQHGDAALESYLRLAMLDAIAQPADIGGVIVTAEIEQLRRQTIARIVSDMRAPRRRFYRHGNDLFAKDFAVCRGKLLPGGPELIDVDAGIGRRALFEGGLGDLCGRANFFARKIGGFKPIFATHFDRRLVDQFNERGYAAFYARLADLLAANPHIRAATSISWWHDPALGAISPELSFINAIPESAGARVMRSAETADAVAGATRFAPHRAAMHKQGHYRPRNFLLAWPRRDAIAWRMRQHAATADQPANR